MVDNDQCRNLFSITELEPIPFELGQWVRLK